VTALRDCELVHAFAGVMRIVGATSDGFVPIADGVAPAPLAADYHPAIRAILNQLGWNLG
jgi:hypothetical protein